MLFKQKQEYGKVKGNLYYIVSFCLKKEGEKQQYPECDALKVSTFNPRTQETDALGAQGQ